MIPKPTALVVVSESGTRDVVQRGLRGDGWEVEAAEDLTRAWDRVVGARTAFDLVVFDLALPEVDTDVAVHQIRRTIGEDDLLHHARAAYTARRKVGFVQTSARSRVNGG